MKRYLLLLVIAIFCLPNNSFAQQYGTPGYYGEQIHPRQSALAEIWAAGKYGGAYEKLYKIRKSQDDSEKVLPKSGAKSIHVASITIDEATGLATAIWKDGSIYRGQVYLEEIRGIGTIVNPDGSQYSGEWKWNLPNGKGTFITPDGIAYTTNFVGGMPHGKGVIQDLDGRKYTARWKHGELKVKSIKPLEEEK